MNQRTCWKCEVRGMAVQEETFFYVKFPLGQKKNTSCKMDTSISVIEISINYCLTNVNQRCFVYIPMESMWFKSILSLIMYVYLRTPYREHCFPTLLSLAFGNNIQSCDNEHLVSNFYSNHGYYESTYCGKSIHKLK